MDINRILLSGRLCSDPGPGNFVLVSNGLRWTGKDGLTHKTTCYIDVQVKGKLANQCSALKKTDAVYVEGILMQNPETKGHWIRAEKVSFMKELANADNSRQK